MPNMSLHNIVCECILPVHTYDPILDIENRYSMIVNAYRGICRIVHAIDRWVNRRCDFRVRTKEHVPGRKLMLRGSVVSRLGVGDIPGEVPISSSRIILYYSMKFK